jgi:hypothetical protein
MRRSPRKRKRDEKKAKVGRLQRSICQKLTCESHPIHRELVCPNIIIEFDRKLQLGGDERI